MSDRTVDPMATGQARGTVSQNLSSLRLCGARPRQGGECRHAAMANGSSSFPGGLSTGPKTPEGIESQREAVTRHGGRSRATIEFRRMVRELRVEARKLVELA